MGVLPSERYQRTIECIQHRDWSFIWSRGAEFNLKVVRVRYGKLYYFILLQSMLNVRIGTFVGKAAELAFLCTP